MCEAKRYKNTPNVRLDKCIRTFIRMLNSLGIKTLASCCGHRKYPMTLVVQCTVLKIELFSGKIIRRKRKFYKRDNEGNYYIPEVQNKD